jgi:hypothetical protein
MGSLNSCPDMLSLWNGPGLDWRIVVFVEISAVSLWVV